MDTEEAIEGIIGTNTSRRFRVSDTAHYRAFLSIVNHLSITGTAAQPHYSTASLAAHIILNNFISVISKDAHIFTAGYCSHSKGGDATCKKIFLFVQHSNGSA